MTSSAFLPTHIIRTSQHDGNVTEVPVKLVDGVAYTEDEWNTGSPADWEVVDGEWLFQGQVPTCSYQVAPI